MNEVTGQNIPVVPDVKLEGRNGEDFTPVLGLYIDNATDEVSFRSKKGDIVLPETRETWDYIETDYIQ